MRPVRFVKKIVLFVIFATLAVALFGLFVMSLWNWLMPALFGLKTVGFWQAVGLLVLARLLLGGFRPGHGGGFRRHQWRRRLIERWEQMSPEEREAFRAGMRCRGSRHTPPPPAAEQERA